MIKLNAAARLKAAAEIDAFPGPQDERKKSLIGQMRKKCGCDEATAKHYLVDEKWNLDNAVTSFESDKGKGLHASVDDNGDRERLEQLKTQIRDIEIDVKEIEDDGDDATRERKHLESLRDEQRRLKEKVGVK